MRRLIFTFCLLLWAPSIPLSAQNTLSSIRQRYAEQQEAIRHMEAGSMPREYYHVHGAVNLPATGQHDEDIHLYYEKVEERASEDVIYLPHRLTFVTTAYNYALRSFYEEFLYDADGRVAFIYARNPDIVFGLDYDFRFYFSRGKLLHAIVKRGINKDADAARLIANGTWNASLPTDSEGHQQVCAGDKLPKEFHSVLADCLKSAKRYHKLFQDTDRALYGTLF